jgi:hypothetical protein
MKVRDWMNNNSAVVTILAVVILVISLGVIIMQTRGRGAPRTIDLYFYDLNTNQLFVARSDQIPPIPAPSGPLRGQPGDLPAGVRAHVFACGDCPSGLRGLTPEQVEQRGAYVAYLDMYTEEGRRALAGDAPTDMMTDPMEQTLVRRVADRDWQPMYSEVGFRLTETAVRACPEGAPAVACRP